MWQFGGEFCECFVEMCEMPMEFNEDQIWGVMARIRVTFSILYFKIYFKYFIGKAVYQTYVTFNLRLIN